MAQPHSTPVSSRFSQHHCPLCRRNRHWKEQRRLVPSAIHGRPSSSPGAMVAWAKALFPSASSLARQRVARAKSGRSLNRLSARKPLLIKQVSAISFPVATKATHLVSRRRLGEKRVHVHITLSLSRISGRSIAKAAMGSCCEEISQLP